jgi:hypothetical protein
MDGVNLKALHQALADIATGVITRTLEVQGRIEAGIKRAEEHATGEGE